MQHSALSIIVVAGLLLAIYTGMAAAADPGMLPGIDLPAGEQPLDMIWQDDTNLIMLVNIDNGLAVRRVDLASGDVMVVSVPRDFTRIVFDPESPQNLDYALSPDGGALAILEGALNPLARPELSVYGISAGRLETVDIHQIPSGFWPEQMSWGSSGRHLYLASRQYIHPEQPYCIGRLDTGNGGFDGVVLKGNLDLVDDFTCIPQRDALGICCRSYRGDYPLQAMVVLLGADGTETILHSEASGCELRALASGRLLVESSAANGLSGNRQLWMLDREGTALQAVDFEAESELGGLQASRDGRWLGWLNGDGNGDVGRLMLQRLDDGMLLGIEEACSSFMFSPGSRTVCAVGHAGGRLYFYQLPE